MFVPQNKLHFRSSKQGSMPVQCHALARWRTNRKLTGLLATDKEPNICFYLCVAQNNWFHAEFQTQNAVTHAVLSASGAADFELALSARLFTLS
jgi:hypothetical protein